MAKVIAVVGGSGEIGSWIVQSMMQAGDQVRVVHRSGLSPRLARFPLDSRSTNFTESAAAEQALEGCDVVVNCAVDKKEYDNDPERVRRNVAACRNLLNACIKNKVRRLIHLSSIVALPAKVTQEVVSSPFKYSRERDWYPMSKISTEKLVLSARRNLEVCVIRPGMVYGAYMMWSRVALSRCTNYKLYVPDPQECTSRCYAVHALDMAGLVWACVHFQGELPSLIYAVNPEAVTWYDFFQQHATAAGMADCVEIAPLDLLYRMIERTQEPSHRRLLRWLQWFHASPLLDPVRSSRSFRAISGWVKSPLVSDSVGEAAIASQSDGDGRKVLWPSRYELQMYTSDHEFTPEQTGKLVGFSYQVALQDGCRNAADWWKYRLDGSADWEAALPLPEWP